jgi:hypothetical protein
MVFQKLTEENRTLLLNRKEKGATTSQLSSIRAKLMRGHSDEDALKETPAKPKQPKQPKQPKALSPDKPVNPKQPKQPKESPPSVKLEAEPTVKPVTTKQPKQPKQPKESQKNVNLEVVPNDNTKEKTSKKKALPTITEQDMVLKLT